MIQQNVWALDKDVSIKHLLLMLIEALGDRAFDLDRDREGHPQSVIIHKPDCRRVQAYLYTYGQETEHYGVHLEFPSMNDRDHTDTTEIYDGVPLDRVIGMLAVHLEVVKVATG